MYRIVRYSHPRTAGSLPAFAARSPWSGLESEIDQLFTAALADFAAPAAAPRFPVDLYEDKDNYYLRAELPGVRREAVSLEFVDGYLTLGAIRKDGEESSRLARSIAIPAEVQADKIGAALEHGVLTVTLPKQEQAKPRKINIAIN